MSPRLRNIFLIAGITVAAAVLITVYSVFDPSSGDFPFPKCPSKLITGYNCPGCGSQRGIHALLNGDIAGCLKYNAMLIPALLMIALLTLASIIKDRHPGLHKALNSTKSLTIVLTVIILWTIVRNIAHI